jgi:hypothetical protein
MRLPPVNLALLAVLSTRRELLANAGLATLAEQLASLGQELTDLQRRRLLDTLDGESLRERFEAVLANSGQLARTLLVEVLVPDSLAPAHQRFPGGEDLERWVAARRLARLADARVQPEENVSATLPRLDMNERLDEVPADTGARAESPSASTNERHIALWFDDEATPPHAIHHGQTHILHVRVGAPVTASIVGDGDTRVPSADVPPGGLRSSWLVTSPDLEFMPASNVQVAPASSGLGWTARFELLIPPTGQSLTVGIPVVPRHEVEARLEIAIFVHNDLYRQLSARVAVVAPSAAPPDAATSPLSCVDDATTPLGHAGLGTTHEWTTPPGRLTLIVMDREVSVSGTVGGDAPQDVADSVRWYGGDGIVRQRIDGVRKEAERFRAVADGYLNDIDSKDLLDRLKAFTRHYNWDNLTYTADAAHTKAWNDVATSPELRALAVRGYQLYEGFFPKNETLRTWLDGLLPGHRIDIVWLRGSSSTWVADVPWGLMYTTAPPLPGQPVDAMRFAGLRFRIGYVTTRQTNSKVLGTLDTTHRGHALYWDDDEIGQESQWQRDAWAEWKGQVFVPTKMATNKKAEVLSLLDAPSPGPMPVLYLFCTCTVGAGSDPVLRFADSARADDSITTSDLPIGLLVDRPFVFANACTTLSADAYYANELAQSFLDRGCRAFLGTETKVPIRMASRFATTFFKFFYRQLDPAPMAAGEAVAQSRLFFWTAYRNIGGLFYTLLNQYELFVSSDEEVRRLR